MMTKTHYFYYLLAIFCCAATPTLAQDLSDMSWKEHRRLAEKQEEVGQYEDAGDHYLKAYQKKNSKKELAYKAGEAFYKAQNFPQAAKAYQFVRDEKDKDFELTALKYARSLKQAGQYAEAIREFANALKTYSEADKNELRQVIDTDVKGCELAIQLAEATTKKTDVKLEWMSDNVNTPENEFAPAPFGDDILYFTSTMKGNVADLFRSQLQNGRWQKSSAATGFPKMPDGQLANGSFSPDGQRFYFTICKVEKRKRAADYFRCEIFMIKKKAGAWSDPQRLRDYINQAGHTATQPSVAHKDGKEILYFSSDRDGSKGGLDIWYTMRDLNSDDIDFTLPKNAGSINTKGDEVTPFYDSEASTLYFSSNGHISLGGMDIFKTKGGQSQWAEVENMALPYNSSVDDVYFVQKKSKTSGFLVSNRLSGKDKITTNNQDIFEFSTAAPTIELTARGSIFDQTDKSMMKDVNVSLYEVNDEGQKKLLTGKIVEAIYEFTVLPNKKYAVEGEKLGYRTASINFNTKDGGKAASYGESLYLEKGASVAAAASVPPPPTAAPNAEETPLRTIADTQPSEPASPKPNKNTPTATSKPGKNTKTAPTVAAPTAAAPPQRNIEPLEMNMPPRPAVARPTNSKPSQVPSTPTYTPTYASAENLPTAGLFSAGRFFRVQVGAFKNFDTEKMSRYEAARSYGDIITESFSEQNLTRLLVGQFSTHTDATLALRKLRKMGFRDAFVAYYQDGVRVEK